MLMLVVDGRIYRVHVLITEACEHHACGGQQYTRGEGCVFRAT